MTLLEELQKARDFFVRCRNCDGEFPLSEAALFDATKPLPPKALAHIASKNEEMRDERAELKRSKHLASTKPEIGALSGTLGKVLEKIAPSLPGFPVESADCRALFEPIDYVVFKGLSVRGEVDSLVFVDVKSNKARLSGDQSEIRQLVEEKKVRLTVTPRAKEIE